MNQFLGNLAKIAGVNLDNMSKGKCVQCSKPFSFGRSDDPEANVFTPAGDRETRISGYCERCFDKLFEGMDSEAGELK